ncbi:putative phosphate transport protein (TIGR00153 family) [Methylopila capsulata]|uniref:Nuclease PIN n=1 Tax=Methylopila capsulata TaxID=61654 RepID=A0A9W6MRG8_9HYPH|nr:DUF47 domain-containing protein [Methylopila capsulata]MBM7851921.1 putative phosphate transport protein (TIGR00153 family) [Methylopila capsulata]GLK54986.1 nuclease PIN [Methylopila capsulata]
MLGWFRALMPKEERFFDLFEKHSQTLVSGARALEGLLEGGDDVAARAREIADYEDQADEVTRDVLLAVRRSFITPFDRGDITDLIQSMDDAIDQMHRVAKTVLLYELTTFDPMMREMAACVAEAARLTAEAIPLLKTPNANAVRLGELTEQIVAVEGRSDELHDRGLKALFKGEGQANPMAYIIGSEIYGQLEDVVDRFEDVANEINGIVVENV